MFKLLDNVKEGIDRNLNNFVSANPLLRIIISFVLLYVIALVLKSTILKSGVFFEALFWIIPLFVAYLLFFYPFGKRISFLDNLPFWFISYFVSMWLISIGLLDFIIGFFSVLKEIIITKYGIVGVLINIMMLFVLFDFILGIVLLGEAFYGLATSIPIFNRKRKSLIQLLEELKKDFEKDFNEINNEVKKINKDLENFNNKFSNVTSFLANILSTFKQAFSIENSANPTKEILERLEETNENIEKFKVELGKLLANIKEKKELPSLGKTEKEKLVKKEQEIKNYLSSLEKFKELINYWIKILKNIDFLIKLINRKANGEKIGDKEILSSFINTFAELIGLIKKYKEEKDNLKEDINKLSTEFPSFSNLEPILSFLEDIMKKLKDKDIQLSNLEKFSLKDYTKTEERLNKLRKKIDKLKEKLKELLEYLKTEEEAMENEELNEKQDIINFERSMRAFNMKIIDLEKKIELLKQSLIFGENIYRDFINELAIIESREFPKIIFNINTIRNELKRYKKKFENELKENKNKIRQQNNSPKDIETEEKNNELKEKNVSLEDFRNKPYPYNGKTEKYYYLGDKIGEDMEELEK